MIIAMFYTHELSTASLVLALVSIAVLIAFNRFGVRQLRPYLVLGIVLWLCVLKSAVHGTLAGVVLAFCLPLKTTGAHQGEGRAYVALEHALRPQVLFLVLPVFTFANAGVPLANINLQMAFDPITLGIFAASALLFRSGLARLPTGAIWGQLHVVSMCGGIGFTMSLFIGTLAFPTEQHVPWVRLGVMAGSIAAAVLGFFLLRLRSPPRSP